MKTFKSLSIVFGLLLAVAFTSCKKDKIGLYSPDKKIKQVYYSSIYTDKAPLQHMAWNGDQLSSITHYTSYNLKGSTWVEEFTYDNNRVSRVDNYTNSEYITYEYDGKQLKSATVFYRNAIVCTWAIAYEDDHISKMSGSFYDSYKKDGVQLHLNPLSHLLPPDVCETITQREQKMEKQRHQKDTYTLTLLLTWTGDNITDIVFTGDGEYYSIQLQYDDKNCPWHGFMGGLEDYMVNFSTGHLGFSKNNVTSMIFQEDLEDVDTLHYSYQYDIDDYPILQTMYQNGNVDNKEVLYYEY